MEGGLQEEPAEYRVSIPSPQLTQQAASIGQAKVHTKGPGLWTMLRRAIRLSAFYKLFYY